MNAGPGLSGGEPQAGGGRGHPYGSSKGFIRAEVMTHADLVELGAVSEVKAQGNSVLRARSIRCVICDILNIRLMSHMNNQTQRGKP